MTITPVSEHRCHLGEGPLWDPAAGVLYWLDSLGPTLFQMTFNTGRTRSWQLPGKTIGSIAVREKGGLILAIDQGFYAFSPESGKSELIAAPLAGRDGLRFNDGKVDPFGSFVVGGMNIDHTRNENCPMFRLSPTLEVIQILDGFVCFNGPCFSANGDRLYVTGRAEGVIDAYDYGAVQTPTNGTVLLDNCNPDGATVDDQGYIWSAQWTDAGVVRITPDGVIDTRVSIPGQIVTSVMFGGPNLDVMYLTTIGAEISGGKPSGALTGMTLAVTGSDFRGRPEPAFTG